MRNIPITAICLLLTGTACSSTTEPDKPYENLELEIVWPRAADASFVGHYEITWMTFDSGPDPWGYSVESGTLTSGLIPSGQDRWVVRFRDRCRTAYKALHLIGYFEARGPEARCRAGAKLDLDCHAERQTIFVDEQSERSDPPEAAACDPPAE